VRWLVVGALTVVTLQACTQHQVALDIQAPATLPAEPEGNETAIVTRVVDGDTIVVRVTDIIEGPGAGEATTGNEYRVRLIGIDTPESVTPRTAVECFGSEASAATRALLEGHRVRLVKDVEEVDSFDRLLRYVYLGDEMANARLVINGYALAYTYPPNIRHSELFVQLQREARESNRGLWAPDTCSGKA
jgi:micrococcal nuclease